MRFSVLLTLVVVGLGFSTCARAQFSRRPDYTSRLAPWVRSPQEIVDRMLDIAELKPDETIYDLGSGDGRVLITAAQRGAKAVGVEISDDLVKKSNSEISRLGLQNHVRVIRGDLMQVDLSPADVVSIYLTRGSNEKLRPRLEHFLHAGARVVSHDYSVPGWKPDRFEDAEANSHTHRIYLYVMPPKH